MPNNQFIDPFVRSFKSKTKGLKGNKQLPVYVDTVADILTFYALNRTASSKQLENKGQPFDIGAHILLVNEYLNTLPTDSYETVLKHYNDFIRKFNIKDGELSELFDKFAEVLIDMANQENQIAKQPKNPMQKFKSIIMKF